MPILFFHGAEIFVLMGGVFFGLVLFSVMLSLAFRSRRRPWIFPLAYLLIGLSISISEILTDNFFGLAVIFAFPWSVLLVATSTIIQQDIGLVWQIPSVAVNAILFYLIARHHNRLSGVT